jgi:hypothetical protein
LRFCAHAGIDERAEGEQGKSPEIRGIHSISPGTVFFVPAPEEAGGVLLEAVHIVDGSV